MINYKQPSNKVVCVGKNYADHAKEMNSAVPTEPLLFMKPWSAVTQLGGEITIPVDRGEVHHELEVAFVIGKVLENADEEKVRSAISGIGLALDLTLRDVQQDLRQQGFPWEKSKGFDKSCPVKCMPTNSQFFHDPINFDNISLTLTKNDQVQQQGCTADMIFSVLPLISTMSSWFSLNPGDIILSGTPAGVSALNNADELHSELIVESKTVLSVHSTIVSEMSFTI